MKNGSPPTRDYLLDNVRFLLISAVVFAHLLEVCTPFEEIWKIYKFIYAFHMPVFIFLFGYNVKYSPKRIVYRWCFPYAIFQCAYIMFAKYALNANIDFQFTTPYWLLWYMLVCIYYQLLLPLFDAADKHKQILAIVCVFLISFLIGNENSVGYYMSLSRFYVFQPWFVLGYYCKKNNVLERLSIHPKRRLAVLLTSAAIMLFLVPYLWTIPNGLLYGSYSYSSCEAAPWMRGIVSLISASMILLLFVGLKPCLSKDLSLITNIGQNTLPIFLLHGFVVKAVPVYFRYFVSSPWRVILLSCAILLLTGNKLCSKAVYFACFSWLEKFPAKAAYRETDR